ncbi:PDZ domain-containing protein [Coraliomargarita akajimensis]|uniref:Protease Do-like PDZ domain-containing protein n=1 Tax=Coraliomargarita akajimensis (strain DSM 45221 / IAM 15411 / JCM 23193 / KCTC 12865 / 04OKA010-24) TaxID=583355 RepID=D5EK18_CORAD|nr:hypothetical protein [Coraliomargarita akajimensis]ADE54767.1 hypothetical protein Caka_1748 [Coraliomargarita akajimensis DSM 45221]
MTPRIFFLLCLALFTSTGCVSVYTTTAPPTYMDEAQALVEIEITKKVYDYKLPWVIRNSQTRKNGIVIGPNQILTTADGLSGQYLSRIRKGGVSRQYEAKLTWVDYYSNLAIFEVPETEFWEDMNPIAIADSVPQTGKVQIYRWRSGRIESRAAEIIRLYIGTSKMSYIQHMKLSVSSEIDAAGWSEVVTKNGRLIGLTTSASDKKLTVLPAPVITAALAERISDDPSGMGYFDFNWMQAKNPALRASKGLDTETQGVVITAVGKRRLANNSLKVGDVLLSVDGFAVDNDGTYLDPDYGRLSINGLATRQHNAGDLIAMSVWRDNTRTDVDYQLPEPDFNKSLIPDRRYDAAPEYLIAGGLVFQPVNGPLLSALGKNKPILLDYYSKYMDLEEREGLVLLSMILPDDYNRGYESARLILVDTINAQSIDTLDDVRSALEQSENGYHHIRFMPDEVVLSLVLDADEMPTATERILKHYRIPSANSE